MSGATGDPTAPARGEGATGVDIVFAGNLLVDDLVFPNGRTRMGQAGGAMIYASLGAAMWGAKVGVASVVGSDYPAETLDALAARGVDLSGLRRLGRPGIRTWLLYERGGRHVVHQLGSPTHREVSPSPNELVAAFPAARVYHLSPMPFQCQRDLIEALRNIPGAFVSLDPHETVREDNLAAWRECVGEVDAFFVAEDELKLEEATRDARAALLRLVTERTRFLAFKQGARGGLLWDRQEGRFSEWTACRPPVIDHTGAGDAFAGGFLAGHLAGAGIEASLQWAVIAASFAIENWGIQGLLSATPELAERRREQWFGTGTRA